MSVSTNKTISYGQRLALIGLLHVAAIGYRKLEDLSKAAQEITGETGDAPWTTEAVWGGGKDDPEAAADGLLKRLEIGVLPSANPDKVTRGA